MGARGEGTLEIDGREVRILFTNRALAQAEQRMNKGALAVVRELVAGEGKISDVAQLLREGMQAANRDNGHRRETVSLNDAYDLIDQVGIKTAMITVMEAMTAVLTYSGEEEPDPN